MFLFSPSAQTRLQIHKILPKMFQIDFSHSIPKMDLPEMPPPDLILLSLSTAAVLASAVGLWLIRVIGSKPYVSGPLAPVVGSAEPAPVQIPAATPAKCHVEEVGSPKERFTVCYSAEGCHVDEEGDDEEEIEEGGGERSHRAVTGLRVWGLELGVRSESELVTIKRRGDLGWYRYQDMTAINGSVVRLWGR